MGIKLAETAQEKSWSHETVLRKHQHNALQCWKDKLNSKNDQGNKEKHGQCTTRYAALSETLIPSPPISKERVFENRARQGTEGQIYVTLQRKQCTARTIYYVL